MRIDSNGLLVTADGDGGDSCHRQYSAWLRLTLMSTKLWYADLPVFQTFVSQLATPADAQTLLEPGATGLYVRHPDPTKWYSDPRNLSRDQLVPVICFHAVKGKDGRDAQLRLLKSAWERKMFAQNVYPNWVDPRTQPVTAKTPDFLTPDLWAIFARSWIKTLWAPIALPVILLGDLFLVGSALLKVFGPITEDGTLKFRRPGPNDVDDDNMNNMLQTTQYVFPTPFSWLARKIYKRFRTKNLGNTELGETSAVMGAIAWYNRTDNPEMTELVRPLVERY